MFSIRKSLLAVSLICCTSVTANPNSSINSLNQLLKQHNGEVIYLDFWASWCGPCRKSFPWLEQIKQRYQNQGFTVISVNVDEDLNDAKAFLKEFPVHFPVVYDPKGNIAQSYQLKGMPSSYLFDRHGNIVKSHVGFIDNKRGEYAQEIQHLLAEHQ